MLFTTLLLGATLLPAQNDANDNVELRLNAYRLTPAVGAPALDGLLDDAVWAAADSIGSFTQKEPDEGRPSRFPTTVRLAFDHDAVYVAIRAYDPEPDRVVAQLTRRDEDSSSDWVMVGFDSRHDQRTAYAFAINPAGVKRDFIVADGQDDDASWDAVWEGAARRDAQGWTAEFKIPLSALRFAPDGDGVWGFQVARVVQRVNEVSYWAPMRKDDSRAVARFGELHGMRGLPSPRRLELLPYTVSGITRAPGRGGDPYFSRNDFRGAVGLDLKYGVTSDLTLDATVNPDFGQVEADPSEVNLSAYESFFSEKRPFFTEGADIFRFGIGIGDGDGGNESLFYSRRIGRTPHHDLRGSVEDDTTFVDQPREATILGAAKLSGRVGAGWSLGALGAVTSEERGRVARLGGNRWDEVVEPMTGFTVLRARRDLNGGSTQFGAVGTGVFRQLCETGMEWLPSSALVAGVDASHRWASDAWLVRGAVIGSHVRGSTDAILDLQQSSARYFQRPDAGHVGVDSQATSLSGWAARYELSKVKGSWQGGILGSVRSPGFEVNDLGYMREADQILNVGYLVYNRFRPGKVFRRWDVATNVWDARTFGGEGQDQAFNLNGSAQFLSYWGFWGGLERHLGGLSTDALRGGPAIRRPASTNMWGGFYTDSRKKVSGEVSLSGFRQDGTGSWRYSTSVYLSWRASPSSRFTVAPFYTRNHNTWQFVDAPADAEGARHYVFGALEQRTLGLSARFNQTFSPTLSLQVYAQPFVSDGAYDRFREVTAQRAGDFEDRFTALDEDGEGRTFSFGDPDFNYRALNLNAVLRWEYRLGSTLYVAWSHAREGADDDPTGRFRPRDDFAALGELPSTNVLLVKMNWWVNF